MNERELQEERARAATETIARAVGLSPAEIDQMDLMIDTQIDESGRVLGHIVYFLHDANPEILSKVAGLVNGRWVRIGPLE